MLRLTRGDHRYFPHDPNAVSVFYPSEDLTPGISGVSYFSTNVFGCRGTDPDGERHRLLVVGGSTTACTALDDSKAWPALVMQLVNARVRDPKFLWVTNSGIDGVNSRHHIMHARYLVPQIPRLDHVLIYAGLNDLGSWLFHDQYDPHYLANPDNIASTIGESFRVSNYTSADAPWYKHLELWKRASMIKAAYLTRKQKQHRRNGIVEDERMSWLVSAREERRRAEKILVPRAKLDTLPAALDGYERNLESIVDLVRHAGAEPIFMAQAVHYKDLAPEERQRLWMGSLDDGSRYVDEDQMQSFMDAYNARMKHVADSHQVAFIDLPTMLPSKHGMLYDDCHFTETGSSAVADIVATFLLDRVYTETRG